MAIESSEFFEYDETGRYYYLTEAGLSEYTGDETLIALWDNPAQRLKLHGRLLAREYKTSAYNACKKRYRHKDIIEYRVFKNENDEVDSIIESLTNFAEIVRDTELDRDILKGNAKFPKSVLQPIWDSGVYYRGKILDFVPEDEYQVGY